MKLPFNPSLTPPAEPVTSAYWFIFRDNDLLVVDAGETAEAATATAERAALPTASHTFALLRQHYLGQLEGQTEPIHCYAAEVASETEPPAGMQFAGLRQLFMRLPMEHLWLAGRAVQIIDWDRTHLFCSRCATLNQILAHERAKKCPNCGLITYPRISPAIIVRVDRMIDGVPHVLLARNGRWQRNFYSVLAGFVEPGETLEDCVHREVFEEVGIRLKKVRYFGSQPWPFPNSLMLGFTAEYAGGDIVLEEEEIADAQWFTADTLPNLPSKMSIARRLVDAFMEKVEGSEK
ncbi:MAG: NAD(+) diphosphatase [Ardenticatenaceae bacterium]|nr:NAD(+) diphosphatase [Anaerolineales bacterium]MCB8938406.1 NAD(+) diphosphatase [Ardenticatenaceae bacterium]MCB8975284.1 NAD(+) diphosphatase [Ardenticatenaceae bacterium]